MSLGLWISAGDLVVNLLGLLLDRAERHFRRRTQTGAPSCVIHNHYMVHNYYEAERFPPKRPPPVTKNELGPPEQLSLWEQ